MDIGAPIAVLLDSKSARSLNNAEQPPGHARPVSFVHETIGAYLRHHRGEWTTPKHDPQSSIFVHRARFLSLSAPAAIILSHSSRSVRSRSYHAEIESGFTAWCLRHWAEHATDSLLDTRDVQATLAQVADQLTHAARAEDIDPLFRLCAAQMGLPRGPLGRPWSK